MKKRFLIITTIMALCISALAGCSEPEIVAEPDILQIRNICDLATLDCYYHNVAKSEKTAGEGVAHLFERDRRFWIEYTGIARLGIDMSKVQMSVNGTTIEMTMPPAKVLSLNIDQESLGEDSYIATSDGINSNKITAKDQTDAISKAQDEMRKTVEANDSLLLSAQNRAKKLIENYIHQLGEATGVQYQIKWSYIEDDTAITAESVPAD